MGGIDWPDKETLERWYREDGMAHKEIAQEVGCHRRTVCDKFKSLGIKTKRNLIGRRISRSDRRFIRYTRWAIGETTRDFSDRLDIGKSALSYWECGDTTTIPERSMDSWKKVLNLGQKNGINIESPRRQMYWSKFKDVIGELLWALNANKSELSRMMGFNLDAVSSWMRGDARPSVRSHKKVREFAELHSVWSPPEPVTLDSETDYTPEPKVTLSENDKGTIMDLANAGTSPPDIAMMYDVSLARVYAIIRD
jgi:DNA-binding transcriptional regulator YiaG